MFDVNCIKIFKKSSCHFINELGNYNYFAEAEFFLRGLDCGLLQHSLPVKIIDHNRGSKVNVISLIQYLIESIHFKLNR